MSNFSPINFGLLIAYFLPGLVALYSLRYSSGFVESLFQAAMTEKLYLGASFMIFSFSLAIGLIVSAVRVVVLDFVHHHTGIEKESIDYEKLSIEGKREAFKEAIENTYRYYQFFGNMLVAFLVFFLVRYLLGRISIFQDWILFVAALAVVLILFMASRKLLFDTYDAIGKILK